MKIIVKISIANSKGEPFMGIGLVWLLERIKKFKSINSAAKDMDLSYAKAMKMLNSLEKNLGRDVIVRKQGGNDRVGAEVTQYGEEYIKKYDEFQKNIKRFAEKEFSKFMKKIKEIK